MKNIRVIYWGQCFCRTDLGWTWAKIRPAWFWWLGRARLFLRIWRMTAGFPPTPRGAEWSLDAATAWEVATIANSGFLGPLRVRTGPVDETILAAHDALPEPVEANSTLS